MTDINTDKTSDGDKDVADVGERGVVGDDASARPMTEKEKATEVRRENGTWWDYVR